MAQIAIALSREILNIIENHACDKLKKYTTCNTYLPIYFDSKKSDFCQSYRVVSLQFLHVVSCSENVTFKTLFNNVNKATGN